MGEMLVVQGIGRTINIDQIGDIVIKAIDGVPVRVRDVAKVEIGYEIRRGAVTADGQGEAVMGLGFMLMGENTHHYTESLKTRINIIKSNLPAGMALVTMYDRTELVDSVIDTVRKNLVDSVRVFTGIPFAWTGGIIALWLRDMPFSISPAVGFSQ